MKVRNGIILVLVCAVAALVYYSFQGKDSGQEFETQILREREAKNEFMRANDESPFGEAKRNFKELNYYPVDVTYRLSAKLETIEDKKVVRLPTSDGSEKEYLEFAYAEFDWKGTSCKLLILEIMDEGPYRGTLFLSFADSTSAHETYGAGRYLDLKKTPGASSITLDFNQAYNPYCAYSENYSCPFPPKENVLKVAIRAGEKKYHD